MKILVLEQDDCLSDTYKEFFEHCGHHCEIANARKSAVLALFSQRFDTILADLPMPDFDYADLLTALRNNKINKNAKIFVVRPDEFSINTVNVLKEIGIAGFFTKSITADLLQKMFAKNESEDSESKRKAMQVS